MLTSSSRPCAARRWRRPAASTTSAPASKRPTPSPKSWSGRASPSATSCAPSSSACCPPRRPSRTRARLARTFRADVDAADIFEDIRAKRDNSLRLYEDLNALLRSARYAEWHEGAEALVNFAERLELFRAGSMRHLMQKDQETCRDFIDGLTLPMLSNRRSLRLYMHRFTCYLEI